MKLTEKELEKLQKLACIKLNQEEKDKLWNQLENIITLLDELGKLDLWNESLVLDQEVNNLKTIYGTNNSEDKDKLFQNVEHEIINNSIVIKSAISE